MFETIGLTVDARGVATLTLDRADKHNALSGQMIDELTQVADAINADADIRVVVLTANGPTFCAGGDLGWMKTQMEAKAAQRGAEAHKLATMLAKLNTLTKPLIGRLQGNAFGGGVGMAAVCDVAIGVSGAKMGLTETALGLIPATIGPYVVTRMGEGRARRVFMSSRRFGMEEAVTLGLLADVVAPQDLDARVAAEVTPYLNCAPSAVAAAKALARKLGPTIDSAVIKMSVQALVDQWETDEAKAGIDAFFTKSTPPWRQ